MKNLKSKINQNEELSFLSEYLDDINGFVAGGCFKDILNGDEIKDIDIFFETEDDFNKALEVFDDKFEREYETENCLAFYDGSKDVYIELIRFSFGKPEEIISSFDFTVTQVAFLKSEKGDKLIYHEEAFEHIEEMKLHIDKKYEDIEYPYSTFDRMLRYALKEYNPDFDTKVKIVQAIREQKDFKPDDLKSSKYKEV